VSRGGATPAPGALASRIATAAALIAVLLAALFLLPSPWFAGLVGLVVALAASEWARLCGLGRGTGWIYVITLSLGFAVLYYLGPWRPVFGASLAFWLVAAPLWTWHGVSAGGRPMLIAAGFLVVVPTGLAMATLRPIEVLGALLLVWIADTAAYFVGRAWGRHKLAPAVSPGKTREGAIGGIAGVLAYAIICGAFLQGVRWLPYLAIAALLAVLSIVGDLFESAVKRHAGVKDSGKLLPGHGGILDRIDSATATLPLAALALPWIFDPAAS
jgi:phosphatidate cytidylyltransferase